MYIKQKLQTIRRYPDDIYDIKCFVVDISQNTVTPRIWTRRAVPYAQLAVVIREIIKENYVEHIGIYQGTGYISDLCVIMYIK